MRRHLSAVTAARPPAAAERVKKARQSGRIVFYCLVSIPLQERMTPMDQSQLDSLENKHASLEAMIDEEEHRPHPDDLRLHQLKKEKLRVKDELTGH
jgi:hypothetical protein